MAREWRSGNLVRRLTSQPGGRLKQDFKSKVNEGEVYVLVFWEKTTFFLELGCHFFPVLVWSFGIWAGSGLNHDGTAGHMHTRRQVK